MNPICLKLNSAKLLPTRTHSGLLPDLFDLKLEFEDGEGYVRFGRVHVPKTLQSQFSTGSVSEAYIETLNEKGLASFLLPAKPSHIILGLSTKNGGRMIAIPQSFKKIKTLCAISGSILCIGGIALLWSHPIAIIGTFGFAFGAYCLRLAKDIPCTVR